MLKGIAKSGQPLGELLGDENSEKAGRVLHTTLQMDRIDVRNLRQA